MNVLLIGGTGLISVGIIKHLKARGAKISMLNRGKRDPDFDPAVEQLTADRNDPAAFKAAVSGRTWDVVIDMICFTPEQADASI
ncbi:MAG: NAD-dependent epimerase/dehydratase family protein, partial [Tepidisphaeraceae bacterium]